MTAAAVSAAAPPGAAFLPPGEIIDVRLEDFQDPSPPRVNGHRSAQTQRPQPGRDFAGELPVVHDEQRGGDLFLCCAKTLRMA
jgi:hypothetical protein